MSEGQTVRESTPDRIGSPRGPETAGNANAEHRPGSRTRDGGERERSAGLFHLLEDLTSQTEEAESPPRRTHKKSSPPSTAVQPANIREEGPMRQEKEIIRLTAF